MLTLIPEHRTPMPTKCFCLVGVLAGVLLLPDSPCAAQEKERDRLPGLAKVKQEEAAQKLERLEDAMDRLSRALAQSEPQNAARLQLAFRYSRDRLLREGMDRIVKYLEEKKLDRVVSEQQQVTVHLGEILAILLEQDIDPRELLKHIRRLRDIAKDLDRVIRDETGEKMGSDDAHQAGASSEALAGDLAKLEELIRREKALERDTKEPTLPATSLGQLADEQAKVRQETRELRKRDAARGPQEPPPGEVPDATGGGTDPGQPGQPGQPRPGALDAPPPEAPPPEPEQVLDKKALERAEEAMADAETAMEAQNPQRARTKTAQARAALQEAAKSGEERLQRLRSQRKFKELKKDQDATKKDTDSLTDRMRETPPLLYAPEGGVPGRSDVQGASQDMQDAAEKLNRGRPGKASKSQSKALDGLKKGKEKTEEALAELQRAFRERLLAYLRDRFTRMLNAQRAIRRQTLSLDLKLRALKVVAHAGSTASDDADVEIDRKDRQLAENLASREGRLAFLAEDVIDLLSEDGTTIVFPQIVEEMRGDILNVSGLLSRIRTGERTQFLQREIEASIEEILHALEVAQKSPPPPSPNQGRNSKSGASPLLPISSELKMARSLQNRVNERTRAFDLRRDDELGPEAKIQLNAVAKKQKEVELMLFDLRKAIGNR